MYKKIFTYSFAVCVALMGQVTRAEIIAEPRSLDDFDRISVSAGSVVNVAIAEQFSVVVNAESKHLENFQTEVVDGVLIIEGNKKKRNFWQRVFGYFEAVDATVDITMPALRGVRISGSSHVVTGNINTERFEGSVSGSGKLSFAKLITDDTRLSVSGSGKILFDSAETSSFYSSVSGSGDILLGELVAKNAQCSVTGSGSTRIDQLMAIELDAEITGSGVIEAAGTVGDALIDVTGSGQFSGIRLDVGTLVNEATGSGKIVLRLVKQVSSQDKSRGVSILQLEAKPAILNQQAEKKGLDKNFAGES